MRELAIVVRSMKETTAVGKPGGKGGRSMGSISVDVDVDGDGVPGLSGA